MMTLYSGTTDPFSQRCRIVLYEKGMDFQIIDVDLMQQARRPGGDEPVQPVPVLVERDLILYESNIINEYIDDRFPHPQLMPADPVMRARARLFLFRFEQEMFSHIETHREGHPEGRRTRRASYIRDNLTQIAPVFAKQKYMLGEEFSMLDVAIAPLLWRLDYYQHPAAQAGRAAAEVRRAALQPPGLHRLADRLREGDAQVNCGMADVSTKPYFIRAIYEWCSDCGFTPYLSVRVDDRTRVPMEYVKNGEIVLNMSLERHPQPDDRQRADPVLGALQRRLARGEHPGRPRSRASSPGRTGRAPSSPSSRPPRWRRRPRPGRGAARPMRSRRKPPAAGKSASSS